MVLTIRNSLGEDHPNVQSVIEVAQEIIRDNKVLDTEILYNIAKHRLKIPRKGLLSIIQYLLNKRILVEGTKCTKETVLSNHHRRKIYNFIQSHLGVHFSIIRRVLFSEGKSPVTGQLLWHLEMLIKFNYIRKVNFKKYVILVPIEIDDDTGILFFLMRDEVNKKIANLLIQQGTIKKPDVYKILKENREMIYYRINELINCNIISPVQEENNKIQLNPDNKKVILQIINEQSTLRK